MPKAGQVQCGLAGTSEGKGSGASHARQGGCVAAPAQGGAGCAPPATVPLPSLPPPNLIEALSASESFSHWTRLRIGEHRYNHSNPSRAFSLISLSSAGTQNLE